MMLLEYHSGRKYIFCSHSPLVWSLRNSVGAFHIEQRATAYPKVAVQTTSSPSVSGMGGAASKPEDIAKLASSPVDYQPPLGPPNPLCSFAGSVPLAIHGQSKPEHSLQPVYAGSSYRITLWSTLTSAWEDMEVALRLAASWWN